MAEASHTPTSPSRMGRLVMFPRSDLCLTAKSSLAWLGNRNMFLPLHKSLDLPLPSFLLHKQHSNKEKGTYRYSRHQNSPNHPSGSVHTPPCNPHPPTSRHFLHPYVAPKRILHRQDVGSVTYQHTLLGYRARSRRWRVSGIRIKELSAPLAREGGSGLLVEPWSN